MIEKLLGAPVVLSQLQIVYMGGPVTGYAWFGLFQKKGSIQMATYETHDGFGKPLFTRITLPSSQSFHTVRMPVQLTAIPQVLPGLEPEPGPATAVLAVHASPQVQSPVLFQAVWEGAYKLVISPVDNQEYNSQRQSRA